MTPSDYYDDESEVTAVTRLEMDYRAIRRMTSLVANGDREKLPSGVALTPLYSDSSLAVWMLTADMPGLLDCDDALHRNYRRLDVVVDRGRPTVSHDGVLVPRHRGCYSIVGGIDNTTIRLSPGDRAVLIARRPL